MTLGRLMLFVLTALAGVGAIYFWAIHLAAAALSALFMLLLCLVVVVSLKNRLSK